MRRWFWLAVALQVLLLLGMIGRHAYTLQTGTPVRLKTAPVDPWDFLRGEYVRLNYEISGLRPEKIPMQGLPYQRNQLVWVTLKQADPYWVAVAVSSRRPQAGSGEVVVQARVEWYHDEPSPAPPRDPVPPTDAPPQPPSETRPPTQPEPDSWPRLRLRYGIEQFYVPQGQGIELERRQAEMVVEGMVDRFGRIALKRVYLDGKEIVWQ